MAFSARNGRRVAGFSLFALAITSAVWAMSPDEAIETRHNGMKQLGGAMKAAVNQTKSASPDIAVFKASAATLSEGADKLAIWFPEGTAVGVGKSEALPAIWSDKAGFSAASADYMAAVKAFKAAAESGDLDASKAKLFAVGATCKGCHEKFREKD